jgi:hypothetical protein
MEIISTISCLHVLQLTTASEDEAVTELWGLFILFFFEHKRCGSNVAL